MKSIAMQIFETHKKWAMRGFLSVSLSVFICFSAYLVLHTAPVNGQNDQGNLPPLSKNDTLQPNGEDGESTLPSPHMQELYKAVPTPSMSIIPRTHSQNNPNLLVPGGKVQETAPFKSELDAFSAGMNNYRAGDKSSALTALEFAAGKGHPRAMWKLGRMYADGDGVPQNDLKAFELFARVADEYADAPRSSADSRFIASSFVMMGQYLLSGIANSSIKANPKKACELFQYAASYYGDASAQFQLGRQHLTGTGVAQDARQAARWFNLAAEKNYAPAQALLGQLIFHGNGVPKQSARGLMWLTLAKEGADETRESWIIVMHDEALSVSPESDRQAALDYLSVQKQKR